MEQWIHSCRKLDSDWQIRRGKTIFDGLIRRVSRLKVGPSITAYRSEYVILEFTLKDLHDTWLAQTKNFYYDPVTLMDVHNYLALYLKSMKPAYSIRGEHMLTHYSLIYTDPEFTASDFDVK